MKTTFRTIAIIAAAALFAFAPFDAAAQNRRTGNGEKTKTEKTSDKTKTEKYRSEKSRTVKSKTEKKAGSRSVSTSKNRKSSNGSSSDPNKTSSFVRKAVRTTSRSGSVSRNINRENNGHIKVSTGNDRKNINQGQQKKIGGSHGRLGERPSRYQKKVAEQRKSWNRPLIGEKHKPLPSYRYGDHYFGFSLHRLPNGYKRKLFGDIWYYYHGGVFYRSYGSYYYVCRPPAGIAFSSSAVTSNLTAVPVDYYYSEDERLDYAMGVAKDYEIYDPSYSAPPVSVMSGSIASDSDGIQYYCDDGVFYVYSHGRYLVVKPPIGALVTSIPNDYYVISLSGGTFYKIDDTLYQDVVIDGSIYFEVVCNL
ncbi:MAG: hypothetical protein LKK19_04890 [Bacteroidales bacterium]|jgi:hypothetical protein|nr:hypothetical protein [Bacteroidales bacterium]MCI2122019.1 hypothetical protein [Bacteroidales bacterium]MCI2146226.1 hypothetical protein [Bacteroidales bacterium]